MRGLSRSDQGSLPMAKRRRLPLQRHTAACDRFGPRREEGMNELSSQIEVITFKLDKCWGVRL